MEPKLNGINSKTTNNTINTNFDKCQGRVLTDFEANMELCLVSIEAKSSIDQKRLHLQQNIIILASTPKQRLSKLGAQNCTCKMANRSALPSALPFCDLLCIFSVMVVLSMFRQC